MKIVSILQGVDSRVTLLWFKIKVNKRSKLELNGNQKGISDELNQLKSKKEMSCYGPSPLFSHLKHKLQNWNLRYLIKETVTSICVKDLMSGADAAALCAYSSM